MGNICEIVKGERSLCTSSSKLVSRKSDWIVYGNIQVDIFEHFLVFLHQFDLRVFQEPTGLDFARRQKQGSPTKIYSNRDLE
jgi:hypothetical protein